MFHFRSVLIIPKRKSRQNESSHDKEKPIGLRIQGDKALVIDRLTALTGKLSGGFRCEKFIK
ncbi:MAG TPA: hypothetical protein DF409_08235 [Bacteroidales bacterium]|nr:hypothetical protein [Bacteroidales bacterium]